MSSATAKHFVVIDQDPHIGKMVNLYCPHDQVQVLGSVSADLDEIISISKRVDMFVIDWNFRGSLSGPAIINRIKQDTRFITVPTLILFGSNKHDQGLVKEFFTLQAIPKPMSRSEFAKALHALTKEERWYRKHDDILQQVVTNADSVSHTIPNQLCEMVSSAPNPGPIGKLIAATLFSKGYHEQAEKVLLHILKRDKGNISALNTLGKIYCKTQRQGEAYHLLKKADLLSPKNIERLCLLGKLELGRKDCAAAQESFLRASKIDPHDHRAKLGHKASKSLRQEASKSAISFSGAYASLLNTAAVAQVHQGRLAEALVYYHLALDNLDCNVLKAKVMFNVGLGYLRSNDLAKAAEWFQSSKEAGEGEFNRAELFMNRVLSEDQLDQEIIDID